MQFQSGVNNNMLNQLLTSPEINNKIDDEEELEIEFFTRFCTGDDVKNG